MTSGSLYVFHSCGIPDMVRPRRDGWGNWRRSRRKGRIVGARRRASPRRKTAISIKGFNHVDHGSEIVVLKFGRGELCLWLCLKFWYLPFLRWWAFVCRNSLFSL